MKGSRGDGLIVWLLVFSLSDFVWWHLMSCYPAISLCPFSGTWTQCPLVAGLLDVREHTQMPVKHSWCFLFGWNDCVSQIFILGIMTGLYCLFIPFLKPNKSNPGMYVFKCFWVDRWLCFNNLCYKNIQVSSLENSTGLPSTIGKAVTKRSLFCERAREHFKATRKNMFPWHSSW